MRDAAGEDARMRAIEIDNLPNFKLQAAGQINPSVQTPAMSIEQKAESTLPFIRAFWLLTKGWRCGSLLLLEYETTRKPAREGVCRSAWRPGKSSRKQKKDTK
jgi:hypothetical protein